MHTFYSHGKLLITGEYVILDGALGLALPTSKGQILTIEAYNEANMLIWKSKDHDENVWFEQKFDTSHFDSTQCHTEIGNTLLKILKSAKQLNPKFLSGNKGFKVTTSLEFPRDWGLGSSSTLINNIANWTNVNAFELLEKTFGGSGYDIACAQNPEPISYQLEKDDRHIKTLAFNPKFSEHLYFIHLNKKQNSREGIAHYKSNRTNLKAAISKISAITKLIINCESLITFEGLINRHEQIISKLINTPTIKEQFFKDYNGSIKSLGAWGGDFVLVTSLSDPSNYFNEKGYKTVIPYSKMILK